MLGHDLEILEDLDKQNPPPSRLPAPVNQVKPLNVASKQQNGASSANGVQQNAAVKAAARRNVLLLLKLFIIRATEIVRHPWVGYERHNSAFQNKSAESCCA